MFGNNEIAHKSAENNPFPLENYFFNIPGNNALDITDIIRDLDISRHLSCVVLGRVLGRAVSANNNNRPYEDGINRFVCNIL
jgi:hypothetical protein